jgi:hypothetical protein
MNEQEKRGCLKMKILRMKEKSFTLVERVPMRRMFLIDRKESIPPIVQFGRIA